MSRQEHREVSDRWWEGGALEAVWPLGSDEGDISSFQRARLGRTDTCHDFRPHATLTWHWGVMTGYGVSLWKIIGLYYIFTISWLKGFFLLQWCQSKKYVVIDSTPNISVTSIVASCIWVSILPFPHRTNEIKKWKSDWLLKGTSSEFIHHS